MWCGGGKRRRYDESQVRIHRAVASLPLLDDGRYVPLRRDAVSLLAMGSDARPASVRHLLERGSRRAFLREASAWRGRGVILRETLRFFAFVIAFAVAVLAAYVGGWEW